MCDFEIKIIYVLNSNLIQTIILLSFDLVQNWILNKYQRMQSLWYDYQNWNIYIILY